MRITIPVYSWKTCWYPAIPIIDLKACFPDGNKLDEVQFRKQIKGNNRILMSSDDNYSTMAFSVILLQSVRDMIHDTKIDESKEKYAPILERISKRVADSKSSFVRIDITTRRVVNDTVLKINIEYSNDKWGVIQTDRYEKQFALILADFCKCYNEKYIKEGYRPMIFTDNVKELIKELKGDDQCG